MIQEIQFHIDELDFMKKYPKELFYKGNLKLLKQKKVSIVGSRAPNQYAKTLIHSISSKLAKNGIVIVSGGAIGIDTVAHRAAGVQNTIMVAGTGLDKRYPVINKKMIENIEQNGLLLSQFKEGISSQRYNFPLRNELVVALGEVLVVAYADENSGTMRSVEYAKKMGKEVYVLPHRLGESDATNELLKNKEAKAIFDIDWFVSGFGSVCKQNSNEFLEYCKKNPTYEDVITKYKNKVFEYELNGQIEVINGMVVVS